MHSQSIRSPSIEKLHKAGLHFVLCRSKDEGTRKAKTSSSIERAAVGR